MISLSASSHRTYRVQYQGALTDADWTRLTPEVTARSNMASFTDHPGAAAERYQDIKVLP